MRSLILVTPRTKKAGLIVLIIICFGVFVYPNTAFSKKIQVILHLTNGNDIECFSVVRLEEYIICETGTLQITVEKSSIEKVVTLKKETKKRTPETPQVEESQLQQKENYIPGTDENIKTNEPSQALSKRIDLEMQRLKQNEQMDLENCRQAGTEICVSITEAVYANTFKELQENPELYFSKKEKRAK